MCRSCNCKNIERTIRRKLPGINNRILYGLRIPEEKHDPEFDKLWKEWVKAVREGDEEKRKEVIKKIGELPRDPMFPPIK
jgi:hypothetical protein